MSQQEHNTLPQNVTLETAWKACKYEAKIAEFKAVQQAAFQAINHFYMCKLTNNEDKDYGISSTEKIYQEIYETWRALFNPLTNTNIDKK